MARLRSPRFGVAFPPPPATTIDLRLIGGAIVLAWVGDFAGFCPGPAIISIGLGVPASFVFVGAMAGAMLVVQRAESGTAEAS